MKFKCSACGKSVRVNKDIKQGFSLIAYDSMIEMSDFSGEEDIPSQEEKWMRSSKMPCKGETRVAFAHFPFNFETGEVLNALFTPASSSDGWVSHPEEILGSAIVSCRFESVITENSKNAWIKLAVLDVIPLGELIERFPEYREDEIFDWFDRVIHMDMTNIKYENWEYIGWSAKSDIGEWALFQKDSEGKKHLVLFCEWASHSRDIYCGNVLFKEEEQAKI